MEVPHAAPEVAGPVYCRLRGERQLGSGRGNNKYGDKIPYRPADTPIEAPPSPARPHRPVPFAAGSSEVKTSGLRAAGAGRRRGRCAVRADVTVGDLLQSPDCAARTNDARQRGALRPLCLVRGRAWKTVPQHWFPRTTPRNKRHPPARQG